MKKVKFGETTKLLLIEDEKLFEQGGYLVGRFGILYVCGFIGDSI